MKLFLPIIPFFVLVASSALSQDHPRTVHITVTSNIPGAKVLIDSMDAGITPLKEFAFREGRHLVCVASPDDRSWIASAVCETVDVEDGIHLYMRLSRTIRITSEPSGASINGKDSILGKTPSFVSIHDDARTLRLTKEGYDDVTLLFDTSTNVLHGVLRWKETPTGNNRWLYLEKEETRTIAPIVVSASSAVLSGAMAAYWKLRADNLYREYQQTGNSTNLNRIHRLDLASGIALGLTQVSLAFLTYWLVSQ